MVYFMHECNSVRMFNNGDCFVELLAMQQSPDVIIRPAESQQKASEGITGGLWMMMEMLVNTIILYCWCVKKLTR